MSVNLPDERKKEIREFIREHLAEDEEPLFYALSGSHLYGFPSEKGGDIDIRGFHMVDGKEHLKLDSPREQIEIEKQWDSSFRQSKMDLVSYELKKFGYLVFKTNFNVLEWIFGDNIVWSRREKEMQRLREILESHLPADVPYHYQGMAEQNYERYLNPEKEGYRPNTKKYLYVLRGLLGARYIQENGTLEPDITVMAEELLNLEDEKVVLDLVEHKQNGENVEAPEELRSRAEKLLQKLFDETEAVADKDNEKLTEQLDEWMLKVRGYK